MIITAEEARRLNPDEYERPAYGVWSSEITPPDIKFVPETEEDAVRYRKFKGKCANWGVVFFPNGYLGAPEEEK